MLIGSWMTAAMWLETARLETGADLDRVGMSTSVPGDADPLLDALRT